jgi:integrase
MELLKIDVASVDGFRDELAHRSRVIREAEARGKPLIETVERKPGKPYKRRKRPLSNTSINGLLTLLSQIMQRAVDYGHVPHNPMKVGERKDRFLPSVKHVRTFLEVDELFALLDAAGELDTAARRDRRVGRRAALVTLGLSGFRISELCDMCCSQVDLARARFKLPDAKTPKGVREVEMTLWNRGELVRHREQRLHDGFPMEPTDHFFGTANGRRRDPDRFRDRVLARSGSACERAALRTGPAGVAEDHAAFAAAHLGDARRAVRTRPRTGSPIRSATPRLPSRCRSISRPATAASPITSARRSGS